MLNKAKFIGHRNNLKKELEIVEGFPFRSYIGDGGLPILFANDEDLKNRLFKECAELGIEIVNA